jgi:methylated-DNA-protein-cysteine methyltransferase-like protein
MGMNLTDEAKAFHNEVYEAVNKIPRGRVTSYGHIAYLIGCPQNSRRVGSSLKHLNIIIDILSSEINDLLYDKSTLPWFRVVSSSGKIPPRDNSSGQYRQAQLLRDEGVEVLESLLIDMDEFGWFPDEI